MKNNSLQFAVVREDPQIEMDIIDRFGLDRAVLIGSGGCTAFCLKARNPALEIVLIEPNPAQIELVREKIRILQTADKETLYKRFGVGAADETSLIEGGNFESLFRQLRLFIREFVAPEDEIEAAFFGGAPQLRKEIFAHPYWPVAFEMFFSDALLTAMFSKAAIQHAPKNSYPGYFRTVLERGLARADAAQNYFLHHIFLGRYLSDHSALPFYLVDVPSNLDFEFFGGFAQDYPAFGGRQLVHFSNIFDWCGETIVEQIAHSAASQLEKGSVVVFRQLNNDKNYRDHFGPDFQWLATDKMPERDRSLFYSKIEIGEKIV